MKTLIVNLDLLVDESNMISSLLAWLNFSAKRTISKVSSKNEFIKAVCITNK